MGYNLLASVSVEEALNVCGCQVERRNDHVYIAIKWKERRELAAPLVYFTLQQPNADTKARADDEPKCRQS